ncbi:MAG: MFS transporter [Crocinitomicaceae bacterium]
MEKIENHNPNSSKKKKIINAWAFYDWANSVYPLVISTAIFPIFYEAMTSVKDSDGNIINDNVQFFGATFKNSELYSYVVAASFLVVTILSPILSGIADYAGNKKTFLKLFCYLGAVSTMTLFFFNPEHLELSMVSIFLASIGFWNSLVFYNAYLPEIAPPEDHDRVSAKGFSLGYLGSSILLIGCLVGIMSFEMPAKYSFILVGIWWIGFSQITYAFLPKGVKKEKKGHFIANGFGEIKKVWAFVRQTSRLKKYLASFFIFSMGIQTIMLMAVLFAKKEIFIGKYEEDAGSGLIISVLLIQFIAILGAYVFSFSSKKIGNVKTLGIALIVWIFVCIYGYYIVTPNDYYILAAIVGLVMGGTQSLSRSTYSKFLPETQDTTSFFSYYDISEKVGIILGMVIFGFVEGYSGDMRTSVLALLSFFVVAFLLLLRIPKNEKEGLSV